MKKLLLSLFTIISFAGFGFYRWRGPANGAIIYVSPSPTLSPSVSLLPVDTSAGATPPPKPTSSPKPTPVITPVPTKKLGPYNDGQYVGSVADAYYGNVQVKAIIQNGQIADVQFLQYPNDRDTSRFINGQAMPMLTQEAIQTQNANVNIVSGATDTSGAFRESLAVALAKAH